MRNGVVGATSLQPVPPPTLDGGASDIAALKISGPSRPTMWWGAASACFGSSY